MYYLQLKQVIILDKQINSSTVAYVLSYSVSIVTCVTKQKNRLINFPAYGQRSMHLLLSI